jgi:hypothetical protein
MHLGIVAFIASNAKVVEVISNNARLEEWFWQNPRQV